MNLQGKIELATAKCIEISTKLKDLLANPLSAEELLAVDQMNNQTVILMADIAQASTMSDLNAEDIATLERLLVLCDEMHATIMAI